MIHLKSRRQWADRSNVILLIVNNPTGTVEALEEAVKRHCAPPSNPGVPSLQPATKIQTFECGDDLNQTLETLECHLVEKALLKHDYNQVKAAEALGITRGALQYKMKKYSLEASKQAA